MHARLLSCVGLSRFKQELAWSTPISHGHGAQYLYCSPPAAANIKFGTIVVQSLLDDCSALCRRLVLALVRKGRMVGVQAAHCSDVAEDNAEHGFAHPDQGGIRAAVVDPVRARRFVHDRHERPVY